MRTGGARARSWRCLCVVLLLAPLAGCVGGSSSRDDGAAPTVTVAHEGRAVVVPEAWAPLPAALRVVATAERHSTREGRDVVLTYLLLGLDEGGSEIRASRVLMDHLAERGYATTVSQNGAVFPGFDGAGPHGFVEIGSLVAYLARWGERPEERDVAALFREHADATEARLIVAIFTP